MKVTLNIKIFILVCNLVILSLLCGHSQPYYATNMHNVPLFQEKNKARIGLAICFNSIYHLEFVGGEIQGAYSITNNIGVMVNGISGAEFDLLGGDYKFKLIEFGPGYYKSIKDIFTFEIFGGLGFGKYFEQTYSLNFMRYFIQPAIGITTQAWNSILDQYDGFLDLVISTRIIGLNYTNTQYDDDIPSWDKRDLDYIINNNFYFLFEPALTVRVGFRNIKLGFQLGLSQYPKNAWHTPDKLTTSYRFKLTTCPGAK